MEHSAVNASCSLAKVSRIFMPPHGQDGIAPEIAIERVGVGSSKSFKVSFNALSVPRIVVLSLAIPGDESCEKESVGISGALPEKMKLLLRTQRRSQRIVHHVEI